MVRGAHPQDQVGEVPPGEKVADDPFEQLQVLLPPILQAQQLGFFGGAVQEGVPAEIEALPPAPVGVVLLQQRRRLHVQGLVVELCVADSLCTRSQS